MWLYLKEKTDFFSTSIKLLHIAPELCFMKIFEGMPNIDYITADLESPLAKVKMDVHEIPFDANSFDVVFCNHVMEHVENDIKAMSEIYRVLKTGGWAIIQSPVYPELEHTIEDPTITDPAEKERVYGQNDHMRKYGRDYCQRLRSAGFTVKEDNYLNELSEETRRRYALPKVEMIFLCMKR